MPSQATIPVERITENRPIKRHHSARDYAHRVRESLTTRVYKFICAIFLSLLFFVGIIAFILWLSLRPHRPRFHVAAFSIQALTQENGFQGAQLSFDVTARNPNLNIGIFYDAMSATVYYQEQSIGVTPLLSSFYQPSKNTTWIQGELSGATLTFSNDKWQAFLDERAKGTVAFRLELTSTIRFKVVMYGSKHHKMHASCDVSVGQDGLILPASKNKRCSVYFS